MKVTVNKLYSFIAKLVLVLEDELDALEPGRSKNAISVKKNITDTLNKLVTLIIQLNKLGREESMISEIIMPKEDKKIIDQFLEKYK